MNNESRSGENRILSPVLEDNDRAYPAMVDVFLASLLTS